MKEVFRWFKDDVGLDVKSLPSWNIINELRLVANVIKHAEGGSATELEKLRPHLFQVLQLNGFPEARWVGRRIRKPLFGQEIYVGPDDFSRYHDASVAFWTELADALPALSR